MAWGRLTVVLALTLVSSQLQCAAWCAAKTCDFDELAGSPSAPPCHRHHSDSSKQNPAAPCSHGVAIASTVDFSVAQVPIPSLVVATLPAGSETNSQSLLLA